VSTGVISQFGHARGLEIAAFLNYKLSVFCFL